MHTSFLFLALLGPEAAPFAVAAPEAPIWQDSYRAALESGREQSMPLAIFVGSGPSAWESLTDDGKPNRGTRQLLADSFVCLYVDRSTPQGRRLAEAFEIPSNNGLVLSTRDGEGQAFTHPGRMSRADLEDTLRKHGNGKVVRRTETLERARYTYTQHTDGSMRPVTSEPSQQSTRTPAINGFQPVMYGTPGAYAPHSYAPPAMHMAPPMSYGGFGGGSSGGFSGGFSGGGGRGC